MAGEEFEGQEETPKRVQVLENSPDCRKHFGYLSERSAKDGIPDECMTCKAIVQCMLKKTME
ncbi:MAG: hypothetical protein ACE14S_07135 [Candidatus Bathyarchaeia archaeon]